MTTMPLMVMIKPGMTVGLMKTMTLVMIVVLACYLSMICLFFSCGLDGERQTDGTDASRKRDARSSAGHHRSEDTSDSKEDEAAVSLMFSSSQDKTVSLCL